MQRSNRKAIFKSTLALGDFACACGAFMVAYWLRFRLPFLPPPPPGDFGLYFRFSLFISFATFVTLYSSGLYRLEQPFFGVDDFFAIIKAITLSHLVSAAVGFAIRGRFEGDPLETYSRIVLAQSWLLSIMALTAWHIVFDLILSAFRRRGYGLTQVLIVGGDAFGRSFHELLSQNPELGYASEGMVAEDQIELLADRLQRASVDEVMLASLEMDSQEILAVMATCQERSVRFSMVPNLFNVLTSRIQVREIAGVPIFAIDERIFLRSSRILKRSIDLTIGTISLVLASPVIALVSLLIKLDSRGPVVLAQTRIGKGSRPFTVFKFRSMRHDAEAMLDELSHLNESKGPIFKIREDPRLTRVGRVIRKLSIDELPQLINVFKGEMSLVGPRPPLPSEVDQYATWQRKRFEVLPGITGLAQISGRSDLSFDETLRFDFYYIENWSPLMDIKIMLKTLPSVIMGRGAY
ncbi:MAG: sugar transferase [Candidatus Latescibacterota bacterium]|nr:sugar transferase [Candidatus Latescibacterota bacterium]